MRGTHTIHAHVPMWHGVECVLVHANTPIWGMLNNSQLRDQTLEDKSLVICFLYAKNFILFFTVIV